MLLSASLLISPSTGRDWSTIILVLITGFICSDFLAIINFYNMQAEQIAAGIDNFKYALTIMVLVVLVFMRNGKLDRYTINDKRIRVQRNIRDLFTNPDNSARLQGH
jgi:hypothetical protein